MRVPEDQLQEGAQRLGEELKKEEHAGHQEDVLGRCLGLAQPALEEEQIGDGDEAEYHRGRAQRAEEKLLGFGLGFQGLQFEHVQVRDPLAFPQQHLPRLDPVEHRLDLRCGPVFAILGFVAVEGDVRLDQPLGQIHHEVGHGVVQVPQRRLADAAHEGLGLVQAVKLPCVADDPFVLCPDLPQDDPFFEVLKHDIFAGDDAAFQGLLQDLPDGLRNAFREPLGLQRQERALADADAELVLEHLAGLLGRGRKARARILRRRGCRRAAGGAAAFGRCLPQGAHVGKRCVHHLHEAVGEVGVVVVDREDILNGLLALDVGRRLVFDQKVLRGLDVFLGDVAGHVGELRDHEVRVEHQREEGRHGDQHDQAEAEQGLPEKRMAGLVSGRVHGAPRVRPRCAA